MTDGNHLNEEALKRLERESPFFVIRSIKTNKKWWQFWKSKYKLDI